MEPKQRHGCVTAWLILMIIVNSFTAIIYLFASDFIIENTPTPPSENMMLILGTIGIGNLTFSVYLLKWKNWAFWGFAGTSILTFTLNISNGLGVGSSALGLLCVVIIYAILQIKKENTTAWSNLE